MPATVRRSVKVEGVEKVVAALRARAEAARGRPRVVVGYATPYAVYVHEDLSKHHPTGQAKFLEQPTRQYGREMGEIVRGILKSGGTILEAETAAAHFLLEMSNPLVPVDTGRLKASGFVEVEAVE
jgi:hypothetical protein